MDNSPGHFRNSLSSILLQTDNEPEAPYQANSGSGVLANEWNTNNNLCTHSRQLTRPNQEQCGHRSIVKQSVCKLMDILAAISA